MKRILAGVMTVLMGATLVTGCGRGAVSEAGGDVMSDNTTENVTLTICGAWTMSQGLETAAQSFHKKYPNCTIEYEYVQNYDEALLKRLEAAPETIDMFIHSNIQADADVLPYSLDLFSRDDFDYSDTNEALIKNFVFFSKDKEANQQIYTIPLGGEIRGMYVNKTLLKSVGLNVPTNKTELLEACRVLKEKGYIPMQGNPGVFAQRLMYPYICSLIANADDYQGTYDKVNNCEEGVSELFREPMEFVYNLMSNGYYNYKYIETEKNMFTDMADEATARYFFNVMGEDDEYQKVDDVGTIAFMSGTWTQKDVMEKIREDYHSDIEYDFIMAPVSDEGGYAYISPAQGIAVNKNSQNLDWTMKFMSYLFSKEVNEQVADISHYIPNTGDSFKVVEQEFDVPENHICNLGQVTFDYAFYDLIEANLIDISKGNNPKYMDTDADGNPVLYSFDYYMEQLEADFAAQRNGEPIE